MDAPLFLDNLQTLKEFNPNDHQIRILERTVGTVPNGNLQALQHSYGQANALLQNPHVKGNFLKQVESWRTALFAHILGAEQHEKEELKIRENFSEIREKNTSLSQRLTTAQTQSEVVAAELRQANVALRNELTLQQEKLVQASSAHNSLESRVTFLQKTQGEHKEELSQQIDLKNQRTKEALTHSFEDVKQKLQSSIDQTNQRLTIHVQESENEKIKRAAKAAIIGSDIDGQRERLANLHKQNAELAAKLAALQKSQEETKEAQLHADRQITNLRWWNKTLVVSVAAAGATVLYVVHKKANAKPTYTPPVQIAPQNIPENKPTNSAPPAISNASTAPAAETALATDNQDKKETKSPENTEGIWASFNKTIKYIADGLTGTQTEVADLKKRVSALEKNSVSVETHNKHVEASNKNVETWNKWLALLNGRPYIYCDQDGHFHYKANNGESTKIHSAWINKDWAKKHQSK